MPVVIVEMLEPGDIKQKRQLVKDLTSAFVKIGVPSESVNIIIRENPRSCWAIDGRICSDFEIPHGA